MRRLRAWLPAAFVAATIFALSSVPGLHVTTGTTELVLRKSAHMAVFGLLALGCLRGLAAEGLVGRRALGGAWALATAYAVSDELHQSTVRDRHGAPLDVLIDATGAAVALALVTRAPRLRALVTA
jgi:VanZ family protein